MTRRRQGGEIIVAGCQQQQGYLNSIAGGHQSSKIGDPRNVFVHKRAYRPSRQEVYLGLGSERDGVHRHTVDLGDQRMMPYFHEDTGTRQFSGGLARLPQRSVLGRGPDERCTCP
jgi:hypothetical protein